MEKWAAFEKRLSDLAEAAMEGQNPTGQRDDRCARLYYAANDSPDVVCEYNLLMAALPAALSDREWHAYFAARCERLLCSATAATLSATQQKQLRAAHRLFHVFGGDFAVSRAIAPAQRYVCDRSRLTIGVDIRPLSVPSTRSRGIGRYLVNTIAQLIRLSSNHTYVLLGDAAATCDIALQELFEGERVSFRELTAGCDSDLDVFLLTDPCPMLRGRRTAELPIRRCPWMSIVYDFIPLEFPDLYLQGDPLLRDEYLDNVEFIASKCRAVFPISKYVGAQCRQLLDMKEEEIIPIFGGVEPKFFATTQKNTNALLSSRPYFLYVGGADARKNIGGLVLSFARAFPHLPRDVALVLVGEMTQERAISLLRQMRLEQLSDSVIGLGGVPDAELLPLYNNAIATVFVSVSEGLGLPALEAMAAGCPVIASNTTALAETVQNDGILVDPLDHECIASAMVMLANDAALQERLRVRGRTRAAQWRWKDVAENLLAGIQRHVVEPPLVKVGRRRLRVAMLNREDVWSGPGGDSRVMLQMRDAVQRHGIEVYFPATDEQAREADVIHAVNVTLPGPLARAAELSRSLDKPLVVTTLYEDWHKYLNVSHQTYALCRAYFERTLSLEELSARVRGLRNEDPRVKTVSSEHVEYAEALIACGESEAIRLRNDFPQSAERVQVIPFAVSVPAPAEQSSLAALKQAFGFEHYVLCVGRLETRKNQLMLLAALQDDDVPIVFAAGGYTPQPQYRETVLRWKRRGPVKVLERLPWELLSTVILGATVHALPSFYELPGLVHLEAAAAGLPIVCSPWGAINDYLPERFVHLCDPRDANSIREAVTQSLSKPAPPALADVANSFTLDLLADRLAAVYERLAIQLTSTHSHRTTEVAARHARIPGGTYVAV